MNWKKEAERLLSYLNERVDDLNDDIETLTAAMDSGQEAIFVLLDEKWSNV